jgi:hypothetical protein
LNCADRLSMASSRSSESVIDVLTFIPQIYPSMDYLSTTTYWLPDDQCEVRIE